MVILVFIVAQIFVPSACIIQEGVASLHVVGWGSRRKYVCLTSCVFNDFGGMFVFGAEFLHSEFKISWICICTVL